MARFQRVATGTIVTDEVKPRWGGEWIMLSTPTRSAQDADLSTGPLSPASTAPSRSASRAVWAEYAESQGVDTTGLKRAEIIAKLEA